MSSFAFCMGQFRFCANAEFMIVASNGSGKILCWDTLLVLQNSRLSTGLNFWIVDPNIMCRRDNNNAFVCRAFE